MDLPIIVVFVLAAGFFFVLLTRWQRGGEKSGADDSCGCGHDHGPGCGHDHDHSHDHGHHHHHNHKHGDDCGHKH
ncbi:MAG: hypothetical protein QM813_18325 [Verrucomicrobiota bacterium]